MIRMLVALVAVGSVSCSSSESTPASDAGKDSGTSCAPLNVTTITGSATRADVDAVFVASCAFSGCHKAGPGAGKGLVLEGDWYSNVVDKPSKLNPKMNLITKGDPQTSFLIHKTSGTQCNFNKDCVGGDCELGMPEGSTLDAASNATLVKWVKAGAPK